MTRTLADQPVEDAVALYAAGGLTPDEVSEFDRRLAAGWPEAEALLAGFTEVVAVLAADLPPVDPPPALKTALLAALGPPAPPPGYTILHGDAAAFRPTKHPGVSVRLLNIDRVRGQFSALFRFQPGSRLPAHHHSAVEECIVLEGAIVVAGVRMTAGTYQKVDAGVVHADQWSDTGGLAYICGPLDLLHHD